MLDAVTYKRIMDERRRRLAFRLGTGLRAVSLCGATLVYLLIVLFDAWILWAVMVGNQVNLAPQFYHAQRETPTPVREHPVPVIRTVSEIDGQRLEWVREPTTGVTRFYRNHIFQSEEAPETPVPEVTNLTEVTCRRCYAAYTISLEEVETSPDEFLACKYCGSLECTAQWGDNFPLRHPPLTLAEAATDLLTYREQNARHTPAPRTRIVWPFLYLSVAVLGIVVLALCLILDSVAASLTSFRFTIRSK